MMASGYIPAQPKQTANKQNSGISYFLIISRKHLSHQFCNYMHLFEKQTKVVTHICLWLSAHVWVNEQVI